MLGTAGEIIIWMVLAALVGFATGWALRSVVADRARTRLSERLEEKRHEVQDLRDELRRLRGDDDEEDGGSMRIPAAPVWEDGGDDVPGDTAEHEEVELGPLGEPPLDPDDAPEASSTRAMRLDEVQWEDVEGAEDVEGEPRKRGDEE
jgi:hypothetical protein